MASMNPWNVQTIYDFNFFCCPECVYRSKDEIAFQAHALQNHELSTTFFHGTENSEDSQVNDIKQEQVEVEPDVGEFDEQNVSLHDFDYDINLKSEDEEDSKGNFQNYDENQEASDFTDNACSKCNEKFDDLMDLTVHFNKKHESIKVVKVRLCV